jgi:hypothetical protein
MADSETRIDLLLELRYNSNRSYLIHFDFPPIFYEYTSYQKAEHGKGDLVHGAQGICLWIDPHPKEDTCLYGVLFPQVPNDEETVQNIEILSEF